MTGRRLRAWILGSFLSVAATFVSGQQEAPAHQCLDDFCIGQNISSHRFDDVQWLVPTKLVNRDQCTGHNCSPEAEFPGYPSDASGAFEHLTTITTFDMSKATVITASTLGTLRKLRYDCTHPERRVIGIYRSKPSGYLTIVGLRIFPDGLRVYRLARQFPYRNQAELISLSHTVKSSYGEAILYYPYLTSNAYSDVIQQRKDGWFGRSSMFNPKDAADNTAELVITDPTTRRLLTTSSDLTAGEIGNTPSLWYRPEQCVRNLPLQ